MSEVSRQLEGESIPDCVSAVVLDRECACRGRRGRGDGDSEGRDGEHFGWKGKGG